MNKKLINIILRDLETRTRTILLPMIHPPLILVWFKKIFDNKMNKNRQMNEKVKMMMRKVILKAKENNGMILFNQNRLVLQKKKKKNRLKKEKPTKTISRKTRAWKHRQLIKHL